MTETSFIPKYWMLLKEHVPEPIRKFLIRGLALYIFWTILLYMVNLEPVDVFLSGLVANMTSTLLNLFGFDAYALKTATDTASVFIGNNQALGIGWGCNGFVLYAVFAWLILAFPTPYWKSKIWFLPLGIVVVTFLNILRVFGLIFVAKFIPEYLELNHKYIFKILVYLGIFLLWAWWLKKFSLSHYFHDNRSNE